MDKYPRVHEVNEAAGVTEEVARRLDKSLAEMESGNLDGTVLWDETSETLPNLFPSEQGTSSHAVHKGISSNAEMRRSALIAREKAADPDCEMDVAVERAEEKFDAENWYGEEDNDEKEKK